MIERPRAPPVGHVEPVPVRRNAETGRLANLGAKRLRDLTGGLKVGTSRRDPDAGHEENRQAGEEAPPSTDEAP